MSLDPRTRARLTQFAGLLVALVAGGFAAAAWRDHGAAARAPILTAHVEQAKGAAARDSATHAAQVAVTDAAIDTLRRAVTVYDTVRTTIVLAPVTHADTARLLSQIPRFVLASDALRDRATALEAQLLVERQAADSLDASRRRVIATQDSLVDALRTVPRVGSMASVRYDPIGHAYGAAADVRVRVVRDWSVGAGAETWLGAGGRTYVVVSHPIL